MLNVTLPVVMMSLMEPHTVFDEDGQPGVEYRGAAYVWLDDGGSGPVVLPLAAGIQSVADRLTPGRYLEVRGRLTGLNVEGKLTVGLYCETVSLK